jgi:hypothetical protein
LGEFLYVVVGSVMSGAFCADGCIQKLPKGKRLAIPLASQQPLLNLIIALTLMGT